MGMQLMSFPPTGENVEITRKLAKGQGLSLWKVRNREDSWDLKDLQTRKIVIEHESLLVVHDFLCHNLE